MSKSYESCLAEFLARKVLECDGVFDCDVFHVWLDEYNSACHDVLVPDAGVAK